MLSSTISFAGFILLVYGFMQITKDVDFPGFWAAIPVLASALVIFAGPNAWPNRKLLSNKILIWFGLISFPLYLWHWPLISFLTIVNGEAPTGKLRLATLLISIFLAWVTYEVLEKRIRFNRSVRYMPIYLVLLMVSIGGISYLTYTHNELFLPRNGNTDKNVLLKKLAKAWIRKDYPKPRNFFIDDSYGYDRVGSYHDNTILFIGDSHAIHYWNTVSSIYQEHTNLKFSTMFLTGQKEFPPKLNEKIYLDKNIKTIVFSYYWAYQYGSDGVSNSRRCIGHDDSCEPSTIQQMNAYDSWLLNETKKLRNSGKKVLFILDNPFGEELDPHFAFERSWKGIKTRRPKPLKTIDALERMEPVKSRIINIAQLAGAKVIDPVNYLCKQGLCVTYTKDGEFMYQDYDHLSQYASYHDIHYLDFLYDLSKHKY